MPQPLSKVKPGASCYFGPASLQLYPDLAAIIMQTIATASFAEHTKGKILAQMMKADVDVGIAMYQSLTSTTAQKAIFAAAAQTGLSHSEQSILYQLNKEHKPIFKRRNDYAHHLWGHSEDLPNKLLLMDNRLKLDEGPIKENDVFQIMRKIDKLFEPKDYIFVYGESELEKDKQSAISAAEQFHKFWRYLAFKDRLCMSEEEQRLNDEHIQQLLDELPKP